MGVYDSLILVRKNSVCRPNFRLKQMEHRAVQGFHNSTLGLGKKRLGAYSGANFRLMCEITETMGFPTTRRKNKGVS